MSSPTQALSTGYYANVLTSEYRPTNQFNEWLSAVLSIATDISNCLTLLTSNFDLDIAQGAQLDILGTIIGVSRTLSFQPSFSVSPILDDATYRLLLRATIANNQWDGRIQSLYPIWQTLFPGGSIIVFDNQDMTATIALTGSFTSLIQDMIAGYGTGGSTSGIIINGLIVPRPQGVQYNYSFGSLPFFGFDREDSFISGLGVGKWA